MGGGHGPLVVEEARAAYRVAALFQAEHKGVGVRRRHRAADDARRGHGHSFCLQGSGCLLEVGAARASRGGRRRGRTPARDHCLGCELFWVLRA